MTIMDLFHPAFLGPKRGDVARGPVHPALPGGDDGGLGAPGGRHQVLLTLIVLILPILLTI